MACYHQSQQLVAPVGVVILGSRGIGKTGFLVYLLWLTVTQRKEDSIASFREANLPFFAFKWLDGGSRLQVSSHMSLDDAYKFFDFGSSPWYFCDSKAPRTHHPLKCVVACSPAKGNYYQFSKRADIKLLYDPVWTLNEIHILNKQVFHFDPDEVEERFGRWGGIPRYVLGKINSDILDKAIDGITNFQQMLHHVNALDKDEDEISHKVFHFVVDALYRLQCCVCQSLCLRETLQNCPAQEMRGVGRKVC
ncbi:hypothetical protein GOP47_0005603 [Adiantum capillus-veneris]|uniref:Uncharacterized protein n=1 Tax=Adiantum capillus-veneris TaxID=13818 RepID=A0A9D4ZLR0_ADICA|nr:hypothetical protein GOP47_0005603 [Adiantum capillus-veneris]